jgi:hypothetical protein
MQTPPTGQVNSNATETVDETATATDAGAAATIPFPATPETPPSIPAATVPSSPAVSVGGTAPASGGSGVVADVTEGWNEVEKFLHKALGEVATNARGFTSEVASVVDKLEKDFEEFKSKAETVAKTAVPVVAAAEVAPGIGQAVTDLVGRANNFEGRLQKIETVAKTVIHLAGPILEVVGPLLDAVAKLGS